MSNSATSRRNFLIAGAVVGAGLYVGIRLAKDRPGARGRGGDTLAPNAFLRVAPDDTVTVVIGKSEMGQGIYTGLAMVVAEELDIDPKRVKVELAGADPAFNVPFMPMQFTGGSMSTSTTYQQLREAGAKARAMLLAAAAHRWQVDVAPVAHRRRQGVQGFAGRMSYGELADAASAKLPVPARQWRSRIRRSFRYIGKPQKRLDAPLKVDGSAKFGIDVRLPGMLFAVIARPPVVGAKLLKFDDRAARAVAGCGRREGDSHRYCRLRQQHLCRQARPRRAGHRLGGRA